MNSREFFYKFGVSLYKIDMYYSEYAKKSEIKENEMWILYALNDMKEHSQKEISKTWEIPRSTINTITKDLENRKIIELKKIEGERRELIVKLTDKGKEYTDRVLKDLYGMEKRVFDRISKKSDQILEYLNSLYQELENEKEND